MKSIKKIVFMVTVAAAALLLSSCGDNRNDSDLMYRTDPYGYNGGYNMNGFQNGFQGSPCGPMISAYGYQGQNTFTFNGSYPNMGHFLQNNPNAIFQNNGRCFNGAQLYQMYNQTGMPWDQFASSPYGNFQYYQPSTGSWNISSSNAFNSSGNWVGAGDVFGGGYPFAPLGNNRFGLSIYYRGR